MKKEALPLTTFRANLYALVDQVIASGRPLQLERHGKRLEVRLSPAPKRAKKPSRTPRKKVVNDLSKLTPGHAMTEPPEWYISPKLAEWDPDRDFR